MSVPCGFRGAELLLAPATEAGGKRSENQNGQDWNQSGLSGEIGNGRGGEHQACGDGRASEGGAGGRGTHGEGDQAEHGAQAEGPNGNRRILLRPPVRLKDNVYGDGREHEQQDQFGFQESSVGSTPHRNCSTCGRDGGERDTQASVYTHPAGCVEILLHRMEFDMKVLSGIVAVAAGLALSAACVEAQSSASRLELNRSGETIVLEPYAPNILRVTLTMLAPIPVRAGQQVYLSQSPDGKYRVVAEQVIDRRVGDHIFFRYPLSLVDFKTLRHFEIREGVPPLIQETDRETFTAHWDSRKFFWGPDSQKLFINMEIQEGVLADLFRGRQTGKNFGCHRGS